MSRSDNHSGEAAHWHDLAAHLVQEHGTNSAAIESYAPALGQLEADHRNSHISVTESGIIFQHTNQPHAHPGPLPEGDRYRSADSYAPFPPSACWQRADPWADKTRERASVPQPDGHGSPEYQADADAWGTGRGFGPDGPEVG